MLRCTVGGRPAAGGGSLTPDRRHVAARASATYVDRFLRGAKPAELPVQFATKYELLFNLATAKALNLDIPANLLALADEVIE